MIKMKRLSGVRMKYYCRVSKNLQIQGRAILSGFFDIFFHSKITDSLKSVQFFEDGFFYNCDLEKDTNTLLPSQKRDLKREDVLKFKKVVDSIIKNILDMMLDETRILVVEEILNSFGVPFWRDKNGVVKFGSRNENK